MTYSMTSLDLSECIYIYFMRFITWEKWEITIKSDNYDLSDDIN